MERVLLFSFFALVSGCVSTEAELPADAERAATDADKGGTTTQQSSSSVSGGAGSDSATADEPEPVHKNGSRLEKRQATLVADDGSTDAAYAYWYDTRLGIRCSFRVAADGVSRCLPLDTMILEGGAYAEACGGMVARAGCAGYKEHVLVAESVYNESCSSNEIRYKVFRAGSRLSTIYSRSADCYPLTINGEFYAVNEEVEPSEFVGALVVSE